MEKALDLLALDAVVCLVGVGEDEMPLLPLGGMMASPPVLEAPISTIGITLEGVIEDGIF